MFKDRLDDVGVIVDTELIRDSQEQCVSLCDGFVFCELLNEGVRLGGVAAAKNGSCVVAKKADSVLVLVAAPEIGAVTIVHECKDAAADRRPWLARMTGRLPRLTEYPDLLRLLYVERTSALVTFECRTLQIHPELGRPACGGIRTGAPPDSIAQALRVGLDAQEAGRVREHRSWVWAREAVAA